jgi:hypothetical protein
MDSTDHATQANARIATANDAMYRALAGTEEDDYPAARMRAAQVDATLAVAEALLALVERDR